MSLKFGDKDINAIEEQFRIEQETMKQMLEDWITYKEKERVEAEKEENQQTTKRATQTQESSQGLNAVESATIVKKTNSISSGVNDESVEDLPKEEQQEENPVDATKDGDEEKKTVKIEGDIHVSDSKVKDPNEYLTIAIKVENGTEVKTITRDEAKKIENHAVLVDWNDIIPKNPTIYDIPSIMDKASATMKDNLIKYREAPSIQDFKSNSVEEPSAGSDDVKISDMDGGSIADLASEEKQVVTDEEIDDDISIASIAGIADLDEAPSIEDEIPSISDLASSETEEQESAVEDDIPSIADLASVEDSEQASIEDEMKWADNVDITNGIDSLYSENNGNSSEIAVPDVVQNNPEIMEIRDDGTIFIGDDYDILSEPQEIEILTLHAMKTIIEKQIEEIKERQHYRENVLGEEPLVLLESSKQEQVENKDEEEVVDVEIENDEAQDIGM